MFVIKHQNKFYTVDGQWSFDQTFALLFNYAADARVWARNRNIEGVLVLAH